MSVDIIIEEQLGIEGRRETHGGKIGHGFMPPITSIYPDGEL